MYVFPEFLLSYMEGFVGIPLVRGRSGPGFGSCTVGLVELGGLGGDVWLCHRCKLFEISTVANIRNRNEREI